VYVLELVYSAINNGLLNTIAVGWREGEVLPSLLPPSLDCVEISFAGAIYV
jgi:hypothetical protein